MTVTSSRVRALETARQCATLGARQRTIAYLTGLSPTYILRSVYTDQHPAPKGRPRYSQDFFFRAVTRVQAAASLLATRYRALTAQGLLPAESLLAAYRHLRSTCSSTPLSFDEAFFLIANLDGKWACTGRTLDLALCPKCSHQYLAAVSSAQVHRTDGCPICRADWTTQLPMASPSTGAAGPVGARPVDRDLDRAKLLQLLNDLGAGAKVAAVLAEEPRASMFRASPTRRTVTSAFLGRPLPMRQWSAGIPATQRVQYAVFARAYRLAQRCGVRRAEALCSAVSTMRAACRHFGSPAKFDRCFEIGALLDGVWGIDTPALRLLPCQKCGSQHLHSLAETRPAPCPFCALIRRHRARLPASPVGRPQPKVQAAT